MNETLKNAIENNPPKIVRVLFGNILSNRRSMSELEACIEIDKTDIWDLFGGQSNIYYFVCGNSNAEYLKSKGIKNIVILNENPFVEPVGISFWYNKTALIKKAFEMFGVKSEILYLDLDVKVIQKPDARTMFLLRQKMQTSGQHVLSPVRFYPKNRYPVLRRVPLVVDDENQTNPYNCFVYCNDGDTISEILQCYDEMTRIYGPRGEHFEGCDEATTMYWFDKKNGLKTTQDIVNAFEPISVITVKRRCSHNLIPQESWNIKTPEDLYFWHG
jgi:hypothetical protein